MGVLGELFGGRKLRHDGSEDGTGAPPGERWDIDLDAGVVRLRGPGAPGHTATSTGIQGPGSDAPTGVEPAAEAPGEPPR